MTKHVIENTKTLRDALQAMNDRRVKFLVVVDCENKVVGALTDGDVRRSLLSGNGLDSNVELSCCKSITYLEESDNLSDAINAFSDERFEFLPVMDSENHLLNIITRRNLDVMLLKDIAFSIDFDFTSLDDIVLEHQIFTRPWGFYKTTVLNEMYQSKVIYVMPGQALSLQSHERREEYWQIVKGNGIIQLGNSTRVVHPGENFFIPKGCTHRMTNTSSDETLIFTEVQLGDYFGEDDIKRYEDIYKRD